MKLTSVLFCVACAAVALTGTQSATVSPSIQKCARSDPKFVECFKKSFEKGLKIYTQGDPSVGLYKLEPFRVDKLDLGDSNAGSVRLNQKYENVDIYGISDSTLGKVEADFGDKAPYLNLEVYSPITHLISDYEIKGQILVFPINGKGKCNNTLFELTALHTMKMTKETKKGQKYLKIVDYNVEMKPKRVYFDFENIFPGNAQLSDEITKTINENGLSVFGDVKKGFEGAFAKIWQQTANNFFSKVPENELFLD